MTRNPLFVVGCGSFQSFAYILILNVNDALDLSKIDLDQHVNLRLFHKKKKMLLWPY